MPAYRAGTATISNGSSSTSVTFSSALPSADYRVSVMVTNGSGYAPLLSDCTYFNAASKTTLGFTIEHRTCLAGGASSVDTNVTLDWVAVASQ
jgi:hypothetical protein